MASITLFSIYMCYKFFADKMYYLVTGYFFLLGVAAVTAIFEPLVAPKLTFLFPGLHPDADYELNFFENKKKQFDLKFNRRSECSKKFLLTNFCFEKIKFLYKLSTIIGPIIFFSKKRLTSFFYEILIGFQTATFHKQYVNRHALTPSLRKIIAKKIIVLFLSMKILLVSD